MKTKRQPKGRYNFLIDEAVYEEFSRLCDEMGIVRSKNIENHLKEFIRQNKDKKEQG
jgi:antitoxin component of RelBE/YafQ-DinJ toxin-antitoxin module